MNLLSEDPYKIFTINENFISACNSNDLESCRNLLKEGASVNYRSEKLKGVTPLYLACSKNKLDMVKFLIQEGANINAKTLDTHQSPLYIASFYGYIYICTILIDAGANFLEDIDGYDPLVAASKCRHTNVCKFLLEKRQKEIEKQNKKIK